MGAKLSLLVAGVAVYAGVVDIQKITVYADVAKTVAVVVGAVIVAFGMTVLFLAARYKKMIANNFFDIDGARRACHTRHRALPQAHQLGVSCSRSVCR